MQGANHALHLI